jgi:hypothetical protein
MDKHVPIVRLLDVTVDNGLIFTLEEFNHLKSCTDCFDSWAEFIRQAGPEYRMNSNSVDPLRNVLTFRKPIR